MSNKLNQFYMRDVEYFKCLCETIGEKDLSGSYSEGKLRYMMYKLGSLVYRTYHGKGDAVDDMNPSLSEASRTWSDLDDLPLNSKMLQKV